MCHRQFPPTGSRSWKGDEHPSNAPEQCGRFTFIIWMLDRYYWQERCGRRARSASGQSSGRSADDVWRSRPDSVRDGLGRRGTGLRVELQWRRQRQSGRLRVEVGRRRTTHAVRPQSAWSRRIRRQRVRAPQGRPDTSAPRSQLPRHVHSATRRQWRRHDDVRYSSFVLVISTNQVIFHLCLSVSPSVCLQQDYSNIADQIFIKSLWNGWT